MFHFGVIKVLILHQFESREVMMSISKRDRGSYIMYVRKIFRKTSISTPLIRARTRACQRVRNVRFSENFANVLNG